MTYEAECPTCQSVNELHGDTTGLYQGYCTNPTCGEWFEINFAEVLASEQAEQAMDAQRDERGWDR